MQPHWMNTGRSGFETEICNSGSLDFAGVRVVGFKTYLYNGSDDGKHMFFDIPIFEGQERQKRCVYLFTHLGKAISGGREAS